LSYFLSKLFDFCVHEDLSIRFCSLFGFLFCLETMLYRRSLHGRAVIFNYALSTINY
jgi:predicted membrane-bound mannosyltransferase